MAGKKGKKGKAKLKKHPRPKDFGDFTATSSNVDDDVAQIRTAVTALRRSLFTGLGVNPTEFKSIIRIERAPLGSKGASCGCGCS